MQGVPNRRLQQPRHDPKQLATLAARLALRAHELHVLDDGRLVVVTGGLAPPRIITIGEAERLATD